MATNYKVAAYEQDGTDLDRPTEVTLSVENIVTTTSIYGQTDLKGILDYIRALGTPRETMGTTTVTFTSTAFAVVTGFTDTPPAGTYVVRISATTYCQAALITLGNEARAQFQLYLGGSAVAGSVRDVSGLNSYGNMALDDIVTVNGSQAIDLRMRLVNGASVSILNRVMLLTKVS